MYFIYLSARISLFKKSLYANFIPSSNLVLYFQPSFSNLDTSNNFLGVPSGFVVSKVIFPLNPTTFFTSSASSFILNSFPVPKFTV